MYTVLVVDDDKEVREVLRAVITAHGHKVLEASTAEEAMEAARTGDPDVISMDIDLKESTGFEVLERLRRAGQRGFAVVVSGDIEGYTTDFKRWQELRIFDVIAKPFRLEKLVEVLESAADATRQEGRLCSFLDTIISRNESSLSAKPA